MQKYKGYFLLLIITILLIIMIITSDKQLNEMCIRDRSDIYYVGSSDKLPEPLSKEEEVYYVERAMQGDNEARSKLIEHNLRLVVFLSKKYENTNVDLEDLVSIGTIGLIKGCLLYTSMLIMQTPPFSVCIISITAAVLSI